ncbi:MAG: CRISPR-associated endonuclease Cas2 [Clostridia bacterium]|nr:CRISPR-associated endonuclease Cas2 [Clostridia bacterium]
MSYRFMRILVLFDLPTETAEDRKNYRHFRKALIKNGFMMWQESVYCRMVLNASVEKSVVEMLRKIRPPRGVVSVLSVTEKQFAKAEYITGNFHSDIIDSDERIVIL